MGTVNIYIHTADNKIAGFLTLRFARNDKVVADHISIGMLYGEYAHF